MAEDLLAGGMGFLTSLNADLGSTVIGLLLVLQLPIMIVWGILTLAMMSLFFFRGFTLVYPWKWVYNVSLVRPYSDYRLAVFPDKGATCWEYGHLRFKIKKHNEVMHRPDITDIYPNNELIVMYLGLNKVVVGKRIIDYKNKTIVFDSDDVKSAERYFISKVAQNNPNWIFDNFHVISVLFLCWIFVSFLMAAANLLWVYPFFLKSILWG